MHRTKALKVHFGTIAAGVVIGIIAGVFFHFLRHFRMTAAIAVFGVCTIPFFVIAAVYLLKFREHLVVPKYPRDKKLNKAIKNLPYFDFIWVALVMFFAYNVFIKHIF